MQGYDRPSTWRNIEPLQHTSRQSPERASVPLVHPGSRMDAGAPLLMANCSSEPMVQAAELASAHRTQKRESKLRRFARHR